MNILFINSGYPSPLVGGVERVTYDLSQWFIKQGHHVFCLVLVGEVENSPESFINFFKLPEEGSWGTERNVAAFKKKQTNNQIDIIINQSEKIQALELCERGRCVGVKLITTLHTSPVTQRGRFEDIFSPMIMEYGWVGSLWKLPAVLVRYIRNRYGEIAWEKLKLQRHYTVSNAYVTLSLSFHETLRMLGRLGAGEKLQAIANPLAMQHDEIDMTHKEKCIIWVGRMCFTQKRPDRIIKIWKLLADRYPDWSLNMVGDGDAHSILEDYCRRKNIPRIVFAGRQNPEAWYKKSSILCLTSSWEGRPLVLTEAMYFGCVPIVYDSFASLHDLIQDGSNGYVVPAFNEGEYCRKLETLMTNEDERIRMATQAMESVQQFSVDKIGPLWEKLFTDLIKS